VFRCVGQLLAASVYRSGEQLQRQHRKRSREHRAAAAAAASTNETESQMNHHQRAMQQEVKRWQHQLQRAFHLAQP
jgi:hypothetical protein